MKDVNKEQKRGEKNDKKGQDISGEEWRMKDENRTKKRGEGDEKEKGKRGRRQGTNNKGVKIMKRREVQQK